MKIRNKEIQQIKINNFIKNLNEKLNINYYSLLFNFIIINLFNSNFKQKKWKN